MSKEITSNFLGGKNSVHCYSVHYYTQTNQFYTILIISVSCVQNKNFILVKKIVSSLWKFKIKLVNVFEKKNYVIITKIIIY